MTEVEYSPGPARRGVRLDAVPPRVWLALMLLSLHAAMVFGAGQWWGRALMLSHLGFFLFWQPVVRADSRLQPRLALSVLALAVALSLGESAVVYALWLALLIGLIGAVAAGESHGRAQLMAALGFLLVLLLAWAAPRALRVATLPATLVPVLAYGLPLLAAAIVVMPARLRGTHRGEATLVDFFYGLLLFLLTLTLALASYAIAGATGLDYFSALAVAVMSMAGLLLALGLLWNPRLGFSGLGQIMSRYVLTIGLPFERWLARLAALADTEVDPDAFVDRALADLDDLPWIGGVRWATARGAGEHGQVSDHAESFGFHGLTLTWFARRPMGPALALHTRLMSEILGNFHAAKQREQLIRQNAYTQAIHDTGARLTHDIKNLLQSMKGVVAAVEASGPEDGARLLELLKRQMPGIVQRLSATLDKLQAPARDSGTRIAARDWWRAAQMLHEHPALRFEAAPGDTGIAVPRELFDSVLENLLNNALRKRAEHEALQVTARLSARGDLEVEDNGAPAPDSVARQLFHAPVSSEGGLGVGLYQAARQAAGAGYVLEIAGNAPGRVVFRLRRVREV
jgi:signal transduction histidine kinase